MQRSVSQSINTSNLFTGKRNRKNSHFKGFWKKLDHVHNNEAFSRVWFIRRHSLFAPVLNKDEINEDTGKQVRHQKSKKWLN